jgi:DNA polymerase-3 subunit epsilon
MKAFAVIDFETTGLCAGADRIIEVAAVIVIDGVVVSTFAELMDPGLRIPPFIAELTGISSAMVRGKPCPEQVMPRLRSFLGDCVCVAHNASFDQRFFNAEMALAGIEHDRPFLCSMLLARRLLQRVPNHQLGTLARHLRLANPSGLQAHRALADALMTCALWEHLTAILQERLKGRPPDLDVIKAISSMPKAAVESFLEAGANGRGRLLKTG